MSDKYKQDENSDPQFLAPPQDDMDIVLMDKNIVPEEVFFWHVFTSEQDLQYNRIQNNTPLYYALRVALSIAKIRQVFW